MEDLIEKKFREWTAGLKPLEARISLFRHVQNIPYAIVPALRDPVNGPKGLLDKTQGSCQPKHYLLRQLFSKLGLETKLVTYPFKWADCPIKYPPDIKKIVKDLPSAYHLALKAKIDGRWVLVDATYDPPLAKAGFPVTKDWDGKSDTLNAAVPSEEIVHESVDERVVYETGKRSLQTVAEKALYSEFVERLNSWLVNIRKHVI